MNHEGKHKLLEAMVGLYATMLEQREGLDARIQIAKSNILEAILEDPNDRHKLVLDPGQEIERKVGDHLCRVKVGMQRRVDYDKLNALAHGEHSVPLLQSGAIRSGKYTIDWEVVESLPTSLKDVLELTGIITVSRGATTLTVTKT